MIFLFLCKILLINSKNLCLWRESRCLWEAWFPIFSYTSRTFSRFVLITPSGKHEDSKNNIYRTCLWSIVNTLINSSKWIKQLVCGKYVTVCMRRMFGYAGTLPSLMLYGNIMHRHSMLSMKQMHQEILKFSIT